MRNKPHPDRLKSDLVDQVYIFSDRRTVQTRFRMENCFSLPKTMPRMPFSLEKVITAEKRKLKVQDDQRNWISNLGLSASWLVLGSAAFGFPF